MHPVPALFTNVIASVTSGLVIAFILIGGFVGLIMLLNKFAPQIRAANSRNNPTHWLTPYVKGPPLLTATESCFYATLRSVDFSAIIAMKVRVADVLSVSPSIPHDQFRPHFSRIAQKHFDFVLVDPTTFQPLVAIEIDDKSHQRADRVMRDALLDNATRAAGLPLIRIKAQARYSTAEIRAKIAAAFDPSKRNVVRVDGVDMTPPPIPPDV